MVGGVELGNWEGNKDGDAVLKGVGEFEDRLVGSDVGRLDGVAEGWLNGVEELCLWVGKSVGAAVVMRG